MSILFALDKPIALARHGAEVFVPARWLQRKPGVGKKNLLAIREFLDAIEARIRVVGQGF